MLVTEDNILFALNTLSQHGHIAIDTETTGLNVRNGVDFLQGISMSVPGFDCYIPFRHKINNVPLIYVEAVAKLLRDKDLIWHHRKFDMHSLKTIGIDPLEFNGVQYDVMLLFHLWDENMYNYSLDTLGNKFIGEGKLNAEDIKKVGVNVGFDAITPEVMSPYACQDTALTYKLWKFIWPKVVIKKLDTVYLETEMPFTRLLYKLEQRGVGVDKEFTKYKAELGRNRMNTIKRQLQFNPASPKDLKRILLDELGLPVFQHTSSCVECKRKRPVGTHNGNPSFNKVAMKEYDDILQEMDNPTAKLISEYRGWQKAVTSLYEPLLEKVGPDGLIRTEFKQHGTRTGRLSASDPNLQQIPRGSENRWNGDAKSAFHSGRKDYVLIGWDYSQLELRLAAAYGGEHLLLEEFAKPDADPFSVLAPRIFGQLTPALRHETKTFVYANLYGAGVAKIALQLGRPVEQVEKLYKNYKDSISGIMDVSNQVALLVKDRGFVKYWDGRRRNIPIKSESYKAWNSVCQGGGAQLVKKAMLRCEKFEDENCKMVLQVHDEITFIIHKDMIDQYEPLIVEAMTDWPDFGVNFEVDGKEWK